MRGGVFLEIRGSCVVGKEKAKKVPGFNSLLFLLFCCPVITIACTSIIARGKQKRVAGSLSLFSRPLNPPRPVGGDTVTLGHFVFSPTLTELRNI